GVVGLGLHDARRPAGQHVVERPARLVLAREPHAAGARALRLPAVHGQAALEEGPRLVADGLVAGVDEHPVRERGSLALVVGVRGPRVLDDGERQADPDLRRGEAHARRRVHGRAHRLQEAGQHVAELARVRDRGRAQHRVPGLHDGQHAVVVGVQERAHVVAQALVDALAHARAGLPTRRPTGRAHSASRSRTTPASSPATASACCWVAASTMTRTSGSVPDGRSSTRPVSPRVRSAAATAARSASSVDARVLSTPGTLTSVCGRRCTTPARSASFWPVTPTRDPRRRAASTPSPYPWARISSSTYRSPTAVWTVVMPASRIASRRPRLLMTVTTSVSCGSAPSSLSARARTPMIWSPSTTVPPWSTAMQRSASP